MSKDTGGPAFPQYDELKDEGMTLRDYFAAKAMQTLLAHHLEHNNFHKDIRELEKAELEYFAYRAADLMIEVRGEDFGH